MNGVKALANKEKLKWQRVNLDELKTWEPIPIGFKSHASFDIAVIVDQQVVLFKNQEIVLGQSEVEVRQQGREYISSVLGLKIASIDLVDALTLKKLSENQFTVALDYGFLAIRILEEPPSNNKTWQVLSVADFEKQKEKNDEELMAK